MLIEESGSRRQLPALWVLRFILNTCNDENLCSRCLPTEQPSKIGVISSLFLLVVLKTGKGSPSWFRLFFALAQQITQLLERNFNLMNPLKITFEQTPTSGDYILSGMRLRLNFYSEFEYEAWRNGEYQTWRNGRLRQGSEMDTNATRLMRSLPTRLTFLAWSLFPYACRFFFCKLYWPWIL